ncbi:hypothetical protein K2X40_04380 [Candidatus Babeliales bacterium]|nr:hypothetical protein [Candidatus Babeliales bacterium]
MNKLFRAILVLALLLGAGYGAIKLYNFVIDDATRKIQKGVAKGIGNAINPLNLPGKLFGK